MKTFKQFLAERRKTPLSGQAGEEWGEVKGAINRGDIPRGFTRKNFQKALLAAPVQPHNSLDWDAISNTDARNDGPSPDEISRLYRKYKGKELDPSVLSTDPSIIANHGGQTTSRIQSTLLAGNTRAMLGGSVKRIRIGGKKGYKK
jgi:hypothetical protein